MGLTLAAPIGADSPLARYIDLKGQGIHSIAIRVPDIKEAVDDMTSRGIRVVNTMQFANHRGVQFHPKDTYGMAIEIEQY
jgi:methylmalonyl-CoA/ethylmalonyl-CoA epimerase